MRPVLLFDLGDTLVGYFRRTGFEPALRQALDEAGDVLLRAGVINDCPADLWNRAGEENVEAPDSRVRPLEERLGRIFKFDSAGLSPDLHRELGNAFVGPMVDAAELYDDTIPTLDALRTRGYRMGLVSNMPWGSPVAPWDADLDRHRLTPFFEHIVFCHDVGWRKPSPRIFCHALELFQATPGDALFIGDRPDWDIQGALDAGIPAVLVDRHNHFPEAPPPRITTLAELLDLL